MLDGKIRDAICLLPEGTVGQLMDLDAPAIRDDPSACSILDHLLLNQPPPWKTDPSAVVLPSTHSPGHCPHFVAYEGINAAVIKYVALRTFGLAGLSCMDVSTWRRISSSFRFFSSDLCSSMAAVVRCLCCSYVDPTGLRALLSCWLIALSKNPGVSPITIEETCRKIISKVVLVVRHFDGLEIAGLSACTETYISSLVPLKLFSWSLPSMHSIHWLTKALFVIYWTCAPWSPGFQLTSIIVE